MDWTKKVGRKQVGRKLGARLFWYTGTLEDYGEKKSPHRDNLTMDRSANI